MLTSGPERSDGRGRSGDGAQSLNGTGLGGSVSRSWEGRMTTARRVLLSALFLLSIGAMAYPADPNFPKRNPIPPRGQAPAGGAAWVNSSVLEIIGASFPTLPEPYVSISIASVAAIDGAPASEARTVANQRVTMTAAEAALLRDALDAWLANPTTTQTLLVKSY